MTTRIYYTEPACRDFDAVVTRMVEHDGRPAVVLDRTAFYPTSGGQPFDTGRLGASRVLEVIDAGADVLHVVDAPIAAGTAVHGSIEWSRRFDHMQQHTGQHVLSAAFDRLFRNPTVGFHMGADTSTIDLAHEAAWPDIDRAVEEANRVTWEDRPVSIRFVSEAEAATLPLRKTPARGGELRVIEIGGFDLSACGGTHVARTGAIGLIAVTAAERFKGGSRVTFVYGGRALRAVRTYRDAIAGSVRVLSVLPSELPGAIERLQAEARDLRKAAARLQETIALHEADRLYAAAVEASGLRTVVHIAEGFDVQALKGMAASIAGRGKAVVALVGAASPVVVVIARSSDAPGDASAVLRALIARFGGKGGGRADLAQGGGLNGTPQEIADAVRVLLRVPG